MGLTGGSGSTTVVYKQPVVTDATPEIPFKPQDVDVAEQMRRLNISDSKKATNNILSTGTIGAPATQTSNTLLRSNILGAGA